MSTDDDSGSRIDRRTYLSTLAALTTAGLAGCSGDSDGSDSNQELGERVPAITGVALAQLTGAENIQQSMLHVKKQMNDVLGVQMDVKQVEFLTFFEQMHQDKRTASFFINLTVPVADRLDPSATLNRYHIRRAGTRTGGLNNYASCEFSKAVENQASAADNTNRQEYVTKALETASKDVVPIPLTQVTQGGAYRSDQLQMPAKGLGDKGVISSNNTFLWHSKPNGGTGYLSGAITPGNIPNSVFHLGVKRPWFNTVYLPLLTRDKNYKLAPALAKDWSISNQQSTFTFNLREDATFHNGKPVTAEDAKWTLEWVNKHAPKFDFIPEYSYESIKALDDHTLEVNMKNSTPGWLTVFAPAWSCPLPKQHWLDSGAAEGPSNMTLDEIIGTGPYTVEKWKPRQLLVVTPYEDHWIDVADKGLRFVGYGDRQAAFRAFKQGSINVLFNNPGHINNQIKDQMSDVAKVVSTESFVAWRLESTHSFAPSMFREFRLAVSQAINRQRIRAFLESGNGDVQMKSSYFPPSHPWYPDDDNGLQKVADSPTANPEAAKQVLRDAGWGWDNQGRLHYPPDKDLTPPWPKGSSPCDKPDQWPCLPDLCDTF